MIAEDNLIRLHITCSTAELSGNKILSRAYWIRTSVTILLNDMRLVAGRILNRIHYATCAIHYTNALDNILLVACLQLRGRNDKPSLLCEYDSLQLVNIITRF